MNFVSLRETTTLKHHLAERDGYRIPRTGPAVPATREAAELPRFLKELAAAQDDLESLLDRQQVALVHPRADELAALTGSISEAVARLQRLMERRAVMLRRAAGQSPGVTSLRQLALRGASADRAELAVIDQLREQGNRLQKAGWRQWVAVQAAHRAHTQMLQLVARRGQPADGYEPNRPHGSPGCGGALLDASA
jgi:hypothetical protein